MLQFRVFCFLLNFVAVSVAISLFLCRWLVYCIGQRWQQQHDNHKKKRNSKRHRLPKMLLPLLHFFMNLKKKLFFFLAIFCYHLSLSHMLGWLGLASFGWTWLVSAFRRATFPTTKPPIAASSRCGWLTVCPSSFDYFVWNCQNSKCQLYMFFCFRSVWLNFFAKLWDVDIL